MRGGAVKIQDHVVTGIQGHAVTEALTGVARALLYISSQGLSLLSSSSSGGWRGRVRGRGGRMKENPRIGDLEMRANRWLSCSSCKPKLCFIIWSTLPLYRRLTNGISLLEIWSPW